jgi:uridine phosphorylase/SAM-dependent methyltransferase
MSGPEPYEHARHLAADSLARSDPVGWFERLYAQAAAGEALVPWGGAPNRMLVTWARRRRLQGGGRRALVVGCGLGDDAEYIAALGFDTVAFDVAASAIQAAQRRFPSSSVRYVVANLMTPPPGWRQGFDLVVEVYTLQVLPEPPRRQAITQIGHMVRPGGTLIVIARAAGQNEGRHPPWPLTRAEVESFTASGLRPVRIEELLDEQTPTARRWRAEFIRPGHPDPEHPAAPPILRGKAHEEASVFTAGNLLREARRQRRLPQFRVPAACMLDPDGDVVRHLARQGAAAEQPAWACHHTRMWTTWWAGIEFGLVPFAVGGPFAVLVAEELASSGAELVISVSSAGQVIPLAAPPYFVLIEKAWRDEGTSLHYQPPGEWSHLRPHLTARLATALKELGGTMFTGASWTTDAPFRETPSAIAAARAAGVHAVEMEAASLYAYAAARQRDVVCVARVTNTMATHADDFDKGVQDGTDPTMAVAAAITKAVMRTQ